MNDKFSENREQSLLVGSAQLIRSDWDNDGNIELRSVPQRSEGSGTTDDGRIQAFLQAQSSEWLQVDNLPSWNLSEPAGTSLSSSKILTKMATTTYC